MATEINRLEGEVAAKARDDLAARFEATRELLRAAGALTAEGVVLDEDGPRSAVDEP